VELRRAAANVANDFTGDRRAQFDSLVNAAADFTGGLNDQKQVVAALDAILTFLSNSAGR